MTAVLPEDWRTWSPPEKKKLLSTLEKAAATKRWELWLKTARPEQIPPENYRTIYWRGGRGSGKTRSSAEAFAELIRQYPYRDGEPNEWGVVAPTFGDCRDICMEGPSGLITALGGKVAGGKLLRKGPLIDNWNRSMGQLYLRDGTVIYADGADDGALRVQGKNMRGVWADEIGLWKAWKTAWDESIKYAVRIAPAKRIVSGTPKRNMPAIELVRRLLKDPRVENRRLRTEDNADNLSPEALEEFLEAKGTPLGQQELEGDVLEEAEGAMWTRDATKADAEQLGLIISERGQLADDTGSIVFADRTVRLGRRIITLDPSEGNEDSDEQGTCAAAAGADGRYYVLYCRGDRISNMAWLTAASNLHDRLRGDRVYYEKNGALGFKDLLEQQFPQLPVGRVTAKQGKRLRAEPVAGVYARRKVTHVILPDNDLSELEAQMTSWTGAPGELSPGQLDTLVYAITELHGLSRPAKSRSAASQVLPQTTSR